MAISEQLRQAIRDSGESVNQIAKAAGVSQAALSNFMSGDPSKNDIRLVRTADKLAKLFGLELTKRRKKRK